MTERIRFSGRLDTNGQLTLRPVFLTTIPPGRWRRETLSSLYVVEVVDAEDRPLVRFPLSASGFCGSDSLSLRGSIDLPEGAARLDVLHVDASGHTPMLLASEQLPDSAPSLQLVDVPDGEIESEFTLRWEAHSEPAPVWYFVDYSPGREIWEPLAPSLSEPQLTINFDDLAGGDACRIAVTASNGLRASRVESAPFQVREKPCAAMILRPLDGEELSPSVVLVGNGWWREQGRPEVEALEWVSDLQGALGRGREVTALLDAGTHRITLRAGAEDRVGEESVTVHVT